jgi:TetR/AcrR family transcriptional repressor of nem operon
MARVVKEHGVRRNEILDEAQRLIQSKGYEQMTIQDILDGLQISKGAFYHYFGSKQELLEAVLARIMDMTEQILLPVVHDPHLPALEKLQRFCATLARWKTTQKSFLLALIRVWYMDDNAIVRQKLHAASDQRMAPLLTTIVRQGIQEGVMTTSYPDQNGEIVLSIMSDLSETLGKQLLSGDGSLDTLHRMEITTAAYTEALERVLGAAPGSICIVDSETLKLWVIPPEEGV